MQAIYFLVNLCYYFAAGMFWLAVGILGLVASAALLLAFILIVKVLIAAIAEFLGK